jgi:fructoselysine-6-P-deglycase FrlB-like protein
MNIEINDWHDSILDTSSPTPVLCLVSPNATEQLGQRRAAFAEEEAKKLSVMVPKSFHKELRLYCARKDCTITEVVVDALRDYLNRSE